MHGSVLTFDLSIKIEILHALLAVSMPSILLVLLYPNDLRPLCVAMTPWVTPQATCLVAKLEECLALK